MNTPQYDGGPAFPRFVPDGHYNGSVDFTGMSLRDWFAGMALQGLWSKTRHEDDDDSLLSFHLDVYAHHAGHCYEMADAMIAARKEGA